MRTPSVRTPSVGTLPPGSSRTLLGAGGSTAPAPLAAPPGGSAATSGGLLGAGGLQALAGSAAPRQLLGARARHGLAHGSLTRPQLERVVARLRGCLGRLAPEERRVLVLLAGLGSRSALSRPQVARRLGLGVARTRRIERRALHRLGVLDGAGRCVAAGGTVTSGALSASAPFGLSDGSTSAATADAPARGGIEGVSASGGHDDGGSALGAALPPPLGQGSDWTLLHKLMVAALVALLMRRELRRQRGR